MQHREVERAVAGDHSHRRQAAHLVEGPQPRVDAAAEPAVGGVLVHIFVGDVAGRDQPEVGHVQHGGVAVTGLDRDERMSFQHQSFGGRGWAITR